jgi:hypothetical protein
VDPTTKKEPRILEEIMYSIERIETACSFMPMPNDQKSIKSANEGRYDNWNDEHRYDSGATSYYKGKPSKDGEHSAEMKQAVRSHEIILAS